MRWSVLALALLCTLAGSASASTLELEKAVWNALNWSEQSMPPGDRLTLAQAALEYWQSFDDRVPRNSPAAEEWLHGELDTTDSARLNHVLQSTEYGLYMLVGTASNCVDIFTKMLPSIGGDKAVELYFWLKATTCYQDADSLAAYLQIAKLSNGRTDDTFKMQFFTSVMSTINGKLANTLISE